jgi:hypothetical protein
LKVKEDLEKPELVRDIHTGNLSEMRINAYTHSKIVLSNETIRPLILNGKKGNEYDMLIETSFDDIVTRLLRQCQSKKKKGLD